MNLTSLYKNIKISKKSIMWITLLLIIIITIPLLTNGFGLYENFDTKDDCETETGAICKGVLNDEGTEIIRFEPESTGAELGSLMDDEAARIEAQQQASNLAKILADQQGKKTILASANTLFTTIGGNIASLSSKFANIQENMQPLDGLITKLTETMTTLETASEQDQDVLESAEVEKTSIQSDIKSKITNIKTDTGTLKTDINNILTQIETLETDYLIELEV